MDVLQKSREERNQLKGQIKALGKKFLDNNSKWPTDADKETWSLLNEKFDTLSAKIDGVVNSQDVGDRMAAIDNLMSKPEGNPLNIGLSDTPSRLTSKKEFARGFVEDGRGNKTPILAPDDSFAMATGATTQRLDEDSIRNCADYIRAFASGPRTSIERAALSEGVDSDGGYTVPTILSSQLIDLMRSQSRVMQAGASTIALTTEKTDYARVASDPVPAWREELAAVTESQPSFDKITFQARSLAVLVKASEEVLEDSVNIGNALPNLISTALAQEVDRVALLGSGTAPEPRGLSNFPGINIVDVDDNGFLLTDAGIGFRPLLDAELALLNRNIDADTTRPVITSPSVVRERSLMVDTTGQPLRAPEAIAGWQYLSTTKIPDDMTHGTSTAASMLLTGKWDDLIIGMRRNIRLIRLNERFADTMEVGFLASLRMDVGAWRENSFVKVVGINKTT